MFITNRSVMRVCCSLTF